MQFAWLFLCRFGAFFQRCRRKHLTRNGLTALTESTCLFLNLLLFQGVLTNHLQKITNFDFSIFALTNTYKVTGYIFFFLYS